MVRRWYDYWRERPGTGTRVSSGGVKIVFSDTNTHHRGESNYRTSGVTDAMRIPKDAFFAHQVMWNGWVEPESAKSYIVGHWNYEKGTKKPVYVVSTGDAVELFLNGRSLGKGKQSYRYLFTFEDVAFEPGTLEAVASDGSRCKLETVGDPYQLKLTAITDPKGTKADGADMVLFQVEVLDREGRRCPLDDRTVHFELWGEAQWIGGIATRNNQALQRPDTNRQEGLLDAAATKNISDNYVGAKSLPVECGINRILVRTTPHAGEIHLSAFAEGVKPAYIDIKSKAVESENELPSLALQGRLSRGETPPAPSYTTLASGLPIVSAEAGYDTEHAIHSFDDNELSEWKNDGRLSTAWITYRLAKKAVIDDICLKLTGWRLRSYPLEIFAGKTIIWSGETERSLGYIHLKPTKRVKTDEITIRLKGAGKDKDAFGGITEVAQPAAGELDLFKAKNGGETKNELRIVEIELIEEVPHQPSTVVWFDGKTPITYSVPKNVDPVVKVALDMWKSDMQQVTGMMPVAAQNATINLVQGQGTADGWSLRRWSKDNMGPQTYKRLFQLLLRLRANTIWPAMHPGTPGFFTVKGNKEMADSCGILIGTSHCEPLLRNNVAEWDVKERGAYNYITNREQVQRYWTERLQEVKGSEEFFTIGMRGIHDGSMEGVKTREEKLDGLQLVIDDQRELIRKHYHPDVTQVPQVFIPYKEVLEIMESGLKVPDDVTLMWCDDNYGYMTRLSDDSEQQRSGGGGVYYHLSYWGRPHDYLWLTTTQPGLIYSERKAAYDHNCRKLWIANVHDPKVAAYDLEFFLDMAWDINRITPTSITRHLEHWLCTQFGEDAGRQLAPAMQEYYRLCSIRKPEFMGWTQVELDKKLYPRGLSTVSEIPMTPQEAAIRLTDFEQLKAKIAHCRPLIRQQLKDAYFAAIEYPIYAAAAMSHKMLGDSANSHRAYEEIQSLTRRYDALRDGKWQGLMDASPRKLPVYEDVRARLLPSRSPASMTEESSTPLKASDACDFSEATPGCQPIQMLGHSMNAVAIPKGGELTFRFKVEQEGEAILYTAMIPTQPNDKGDLRYTVQIDDQSPVTISLKEPYRSEFWKLSVLRGQALKQTPVTLQKGPHTLTIKALDDHIIADQWMIDFKPDRQFYMIPAL